VLGLIWFDAVGTLDWRLHPGPAAAALGAAARRADLAEPLPLAPARGTRVPSSPRVSESADPANRP